MLKPKSLGGAFASNSARETIIAACFCLALAVHLACVHFRRERRRMPDKTPPEPWLRGTLAEVPSVHRAVLHALELAGEDLQRWCGQLSDEQLNQRPAEIAPVAFHLRHISRSLDRLLTYAEGGSLNEKQLAALKSELSPGAMRRELFAELSAALASSATRIRRFSDGDLEVSRTVGRDNLPTTLGGLLVHIAEHTQRHVGQAITTAKIVLGQTG
jgi:uncharacterized damage-inducible protein DinB